MMKLSLPNAPTERSPRSRHVAPVLHLVVVLCHAAALSLVWFAQTGCSGAAEGNHNNSTPTGIPCNTDEDCATFGMLCSPHKVCLPRAVGSHRFGLELRPPADAELQFGLKLAQHELAPLDLSLRDGSTVVEMPEAVRVTGTVTVVDTVPMEVTVTASRLSRIPGRPKVLISRGVVADGILLRPNRDDVVPTFDVLLTRDATYLLRAVPEAPYDQQYHPFATTILTDGDSTEWLVFGDPELSIHVAGTLLDSLGDGVPDVRVQAVDEASGQRVSSVGITDTAGTFRLRLPRGVRSYTLAFTPHTQDSGVPEIVHENVIIGLLAEEQGPDHGYDNPEWLGRFQLPAYPTPQRFSFHLLGRASSGAEVPIAGATVTFTTRVGYEATLVGTFVASALSDEGGLVAVDLVPGTTGQIRAYTVVVVPPQSSEFAAEGFSEDRAVEVGAIGGVGQTIWLSRRVAFIGAVLSASLLPATDVIVQARRLDGSEEIRNSLRATTTKQDGRFSLWLDPGSHGVEILPPTGIPLPRWSVPEVLSVPAQGLQVIDMANLVFPEAAVLEIQVVAASPTRAPLGGVVVAVYLVDAFCAALNPVDFALCRREPMFVGEAVSDAHGRARVLVPRP